MARSVKLDDGTVWPIDPGTDEQDSTEWCLRYASGRADRLHAAEIIAAYKQLVRLPLSRSREVLREIRAKVREAAQPGREGP